MLNTFTVSFFGHRMIDNTLEIENSLERLIQTLLREHEYIEFLVGRDGEFDQLVSSVIRRCKRNIRDDNSAHVWVLPYPTAGYRDNEDAYREYYDEIESGHLCPCLCISGQRLCHASDNRSSV